MEQKSEQFRYLSGRVDASVTADAPQQIRTARLIHTATQPLDPGPRFPWERLAKLGYGAWYDIDTVVKYLRVFGTWEPDATLVQQALKAYGYDIEVTGEFDKQTKLVIGAFQLHFDQANVTGEPAPSTMARLFALIEKYLPRDLAKFDMAD